MNEDLETIIREVYSCYDVRYGNAIVDLKQRIDKAIEYIEDTQTIKDEVFEDEYGIPISIKSKLMVGSETLLDILKGSDKE